MARSYRKHLFRRRCSKFYKWYSNRKVRRTSGIPSGRAYQKVIDPWDICDIRYNWYSWYGGWANFNNKPDSYTGEDYAQNIRWIRNK
jgi:hypothetical protein